MFERYAKVAFVVEMCGESIDGRKKLQKLVFIAKVLGTPLERDLPCIGMGLILMNWQQRSSV
jgi:uncharacterized protein YwgA